MTLIGLTGEERKYEMDARGKSIPENRRLNLKYGKVTRPYKMAEVSNSKVTEVRPASKCPCKARRKRADIDPLLLVRIPSMAIDHGHR